MNFKLKDLTIILEAKKIFSLTLQQTEDLISVPWPDINTRIIRSFLVFSRDELRPVSHLHSRDRFYSRPEQSSSRGSWLKEGKAEL